MKTMKTNRLFAIPLILAAAVPAFAEPAATPKVVRLCAVSQSRAGKDRNLDHVLAILQQAAEQRAEVVCLPQDCVPTDGGPAARAALDAIARAAAEGQMYVAANLKERDGDQLYSTSYLLGPDGRVIGKYRKSHRLPDEDIALGNDLPVFDTPLGKIGLMIGTDHYWPEVPLVMALEGAELILASLGVEPVPQQFPLEVTLRARAFDDHVTLAASNYAGDLPYLCSNYPTYTGQPLGRGCVIDRAGIILADTGIRPGVAVAPVDLGRPKDVYHLTFKEDRSLFHYLSDASPAESNEPADASSRPTEATVTAVGEKDLLEFRLGSDGGLRAGDRVDVYRDNTFLGRAVLLKTDPDCAVAQMIEKSQGDSVKVGDCIRCLTLRKIRISIATVGFEHGPNPRPDSEFSKILDEAGKLGSDVILMTEFGLATDDENGQRTLALIAGKARQYRSYIIIGGLRDPQIPYSSGGRASWAYLWDRSGQVVGKYRISQYGDSVELPVFQTDFGVIGIMLCGDVYSQEISRALALQGAEVIFCPSQSWGASGQFNLWLQQARAIDNGVWIAASHLPMSEISQRSYVLDPYGFVQAASRYWSDSVCTAEVDLDAGPTWFARSDKPGRAGQPGYLAGYYPRTVPERRDDLRSVLLAGRRPELYKAIPEKTLAGRMYSEEVQKRMSEPQP